MRRGEAEQAEALFARSQQQKDLMLMAGRLTEAANPAYQLIEPVEETLRTTARLFGNLGMSREAAIVERELEKQAVASKPAARRNTSSARRRRRAFDVCLAR